MYFNGKKMSVLATVATETYNANVYVDEYGVLQMEKVIDPMVAGLQPKDITDAVELGYMYGGDNLTVCEIVNKEYTYIPTLGVVFYSVVFKYQGAVAAGETVAFEIGGRYKPKAGEGNLPAVAACDNSNFTAVYGRNDALEITAAKDVQADSETVCYISGWYNSDGE